jgi:SAM-dependent methyltransferase
VFDHRLAQVYDIVYESRGQNFAAEAVEISQLIRARRADTASLLDVGCGTGEHLRSLRTLFDHVEGVDRSASMVSVARTKLPTVAVHQMDMCRFDLGRTFDSVISLSSAVAYLPSLDAFDAAIARMAEHLSGAGVLVVEPWYFPENFLDGYVASDLIRHDRRTISRVSHTRRLIDAARIDSHYVIADPHGVQHFTESHVLRLWHPEQYFDAFSRVGCDARYIPAIQSGHGVFVAQRHDR